MTLQENNWIAIVDGKTGTVTGGFSAGATGVEGVDTKNDGKIDFSGEQGRRAARARCGQVARQ